MRYPRPLKVALIITPLIQPHDQLDVGLDKVGNVVGGSEHAEALGGDDLLGLGTGEGEDLVLDDPVEVTVFDLFEVFVFGDVEGGGLAWFAHW